MNFPVEKVRADFPVLTREVNGLPLAYLDSAASAQKPAQVIEAEAAIVCPGDDLVSLFPEQIAQAGLVRCKLQMMRLASPGFTLPAPVMSDLGLTRYGGYAALPEAAAT